MPTIVVKSIGATNTPTTMDYSTIAAWESAAPTDLTLTRSNTAVVGATSSTIILDASASGSNDFYTGHPIWCDARPAEKRLITAYNGTTKVATIGALNGSNATWDNTPIAEAYTVDSVVWKGECYNQGEFVVAGATTISGSTSSSTCYKWLTTAAGASFRDNVSASTNALKYNTSNGVCFRNTATGTGSITLSENYARLSNFQIQATGSISICIGGTGSNLTISNCICNPSSASSQDQGIVLTGSNNTIINCLVYSTGASSPTTVRGISCGGTGTGNAAYNCTMCRASNLGAGPASSTCYLGNATGALLVKNCAGFGMNTFDSNCSSSSSNNASDKTISVGTSNQASLTYANQFVSTTSGAPDFKSVVTGSLKNGTPDSTNAPTDIIGTTRDATTPYIGCWEVAAVVTNLIAKVVSIFQSVSRSYSW